ncbi:MAG: toxin-activating lysine-acyltransferase [Pseudomonadota bacterium]
MTAKDNSTIPAKANGAAKPSAKKPSPQKKGAPSVASTEPSKEISPEMLAKLSELRERVQLSVGQAVLAMMNLPRYKGQSLADLNHLVIEPLLRDRLAIASAKKKDGADEGAPDGSTTAGIAIWASVSDEVDAKIREQIKGGAFPTRLGAEDWASGETIWLLDLIAPNRQLATAVLANFKQIAGDKPIAIHPIVARSVDPEVLEKMKMKGE